MFSPSSALMEEQLATEQVIKIITHNYIYETITEYEQGPFPYQVEIKAFSLMTRSILGPKEPFWLAWKRKFLFTGEVNRVCSTDTEPKLLIFLPQLVKAWSLFWKHTSLQYPALWQSRIVPTCTSCTNLKVTVLLNKSQFPHGHLMSDSPLEAFSLSSFHLCEVLPYSPNTCFPSPVHVPSTQFVLQF